MPFVIWPEDGEKLLIEDQVARGSYLLGAC